MMIRLFLFVALAYWGSGLIVRGSYLVGSAILFFALMSLYKIWHDPDRRLWKRICKEAKDNHVSLVEDYRLQKSLRTLFRKSDQMYAMHPHLASELMGLRSSMWEQMASQPIHTWSATVESVLKQWPAMPKQDNLELRMRRMRQAVGRMEEARREACGSRSSSQQ